jgi:hypothetical protein
VAEVRADQRGLLQERVALARPLDEELVRAREALDRGFPEEAVERLGRYRADPRAAEMLAQAAVMLKRPANAMVEPTPEVLAAKDRALKLVAIVSVLIAITGLVAAVLIGIST